MPRLSIIIATADGSTALEETLLSVLENRPDDCEVIVAHPSCYSDPYALDGEVRFVPLARSATRLDCLQGAIAASDGDLVHILAPGAAVEPGWAEEAQVFFADRRVGSVTPLVMDRRDHTRIVAAGVDYSLGGARELCGAGQTWQEARADRFAPLGPSLAAGFYRRSALEAVDGLNVALGERLIDVDLALSLATAGYNTVLAAESRVYFAAAPTSARQSAFETGRTAEALFWRHAPRASWARAILAHAFVVGRETLLNPLRAPLVCAGRLASLLTVGTSEKASKEADHHGEKPRTISGAWSRIDRAHSGQADKRETGEQSRKAS